MNQGAFKWLTTFMDYQFWKLAISGTKRKSFNMFYEELSPQTKSPDTRVTVSRQTVYTFNRSGPVRQKYEVPEKILYKSPGFT